MAKNWGLKKPAKEREEESKMENENKGMPIKEAHERDIFKERGAKFSEPSS